jgi:hypothetical protein
MAFKATFTKPNLSSMRRNVQKAVDAASVVIGTKLAEALLVEVLKRIPKTDVWTKLYRNSLRVEVQPPDVFLLVADTDADLQTFPADKTAVFVEGDNVVASILKRYNPWPIDMLPAIKGGATIDLRTVPSGLAETNKLRENLLPEMEAVKEALSKEGFTVENGGIPVFNGRTYFDLKFMAMRLEHGLGPFKPTPHWGPAKKATVDQVDRIVGRVSPEIIQAMKDNL